MPSTMPILLEGANLGERHQSFNSKVISTFTQKIDLKSILEVTEKSPIDKLFKIDLASKHRDVEYILLALKEDDMLYVSRALKCLWLLEPQYRDVINPKHLEEEIFPHMIQPAVNKTRHWLQNNLREPARCQQFYEYYRSQFNIAIKFLYHCSSDYIIDEIINVFDQMKPQNLKIICETCPKACKIFYDNLQTNKSALSRYLSDASSYFKSIRGVLKLDGSLYLDILEKYFDILSFKHLNASATQHIMINYRDRFNAKQELYAMYVLDIKALSNHLTAAEAKDLVLKLARAEYLDPWFNYQKVESLVKRLNVDERAAFKKLVFEDKSFGDRVKEWPYPPPITLSSGTIDEKDFFSDYEREPSDSPFALVEACSFKRCLKKRKYAKYSCVEQCLRKTPLEILFDTYRFAGFERTFTELSKKLLSESTIEGRLNMLLVLVSKSGGVPEQVAKLLELLHKRHINEPINLRAAVVRSFVKRSCAWRFSLESWDILMQFGRDLGLDGQRAELLCREGLHAVVIRHLIQDIQLNPAVLSSFLDQMSTLNEYKLNGQEREVVAKRLSVLLLDVKPDAFLDVVTNYGLKINTIPSAEAKLVEAARSDADLARKLYHSRIGRRHLLRESFAFVQTNESYVNALRHDTSVLEEGKSFTKHISEERPRHDKFLQSLNLYFNESNGLAAQHKDCLTETLKLKPRTWIARPITVLSTSDALLSLIKEIPSMDIPDNNKKQLVNSFKANIHKCKPTLDITKFDPSWIGAQALANKALVCRAKDRDSYVKLLLQWSRTAEIAFQLGLMTKTSTETFIAATAGRPALGLKIAKKVYLKRDSLDPVVWNVIRGFILGLDTKKVPIKVLEPFIYNDKIPDDIKLDYWVIIYNLVRKIDKRRTMSILTRIENMLPDLEEDVVRDIIVQLINEEFDSDIFMPDEYENDRGLYSRILAKHLLTSKSEKTQNEKLETCNRFFDKLDSLYEKSDENVKNYLNGCVFEFIRALKYNKAFLSEKYVSSLPVFERVLARLKTILPLQEYFGIYIEMHLIMLYYKSLKESVEQKSEVFGNLKQNMVEAIETVGLNYGQNIGREVKELSTSYYFSILDIYKKVLNNFLDQNFNFNDSLKYMVVPLIKSLIKDGQNETLILAEYVYDSKRRYIIPEEHHDDILNLLKGCNNEMLNFFLYTDIIGQD